MGVMDAVICFNESAYVRTEVLKALKINLGINTCEGLRKIEYVRICEAEMAVQKASTEAKTTKRQIKIKQDGLEQSIQDEYSAEKFLNINFRNKFKCTKEIANLSVLPINLSPDDIEINIAPDIPQICESKNKTITPNCVPVKKDGLHVKYDQTVTVSPVVKVPVELQHPSDLPKLEDDLKRLEKPDPMIQCVTEKPDEYIVSNSVEFLSENCLKDVKEDKACIPLKKIDTIVVVPEMSSGGPADSRMAVWCRPLFPSHSNYSTHHAHERTECFGSLSVVRCSTRREPTQCKRGTTPLKKDVGMDEMTD
ncbi:translational elongation factor-2 [Trichonephila clavipes]|nr:translational elongation factor-2 [Trichonephila clavipes]